MSIDLSVVIPAHNEEHCVYESVVRLNEALTAESIAHELIIVNDNSRDNTSDVLAKLEKKIETVRVLNRTGKNGFGLAVRDGLQLASGNIVAIVMADGSDPPGDVVRFYHEFATGVDCVFGSRFIEGGAAVQYPWFKYVLNRLFNNMIRLLFQINYNDTTNAFKMYRRHVIDGMQPLLSHHFNLTVEMPLKAIIRGYSYKVLPNHWYNRTTGVSKLKLKEMGSRYLFSILYCCLEKWLSRGDYRRK